jgi:hypothetical protein
LLPLALRTGRTATVEARIVALPVDHRRSPRITAESKNHLAIERACNEANTVGIDESGTYKKRAVIKKTVLCGESGDNIH